MCFSSLTDENGLLISFSFSLLDYGFLVLSAFNTDCRSVLC